MRGKPIVLLALVEDELERSKGKTQQAEPEEIELDATLLRLQDLLMNVRWIFHDSRCQEQRQQADWNIEKEDPSPVVVICDPTTKRWSDRRRNYNSQAIHREGLPSLFRWKGVGKNRLLRRSKPASANALQDAKEDKQRQRGCETAER